MIAEIREQIVLLFIVLLYFCIVVKDFLSVRDTYSVHMIITRDQREVYKTRIAPRTRGCLTVLQLNIASRNLNVLTSTLLKAVNVLYLGDLYGCVWHFDG
jgi:hypothetical protein